MMICRGSQFCYLRILTLYNKEIDKSPIENAKEKHFIKAKRDNLLKFQCDLCPLYFIAEDGLFNHRRKKHECLSSDPHKIPQKNETIEGDFLLRKIEFSATFVFLINSQKIYLAGQKCHFLICKTQKNHRVPPVKKNFRIFFLLF